MWVVAWKIILVEFTQIEVTSEENVQFLHMMIMTNTVKPLYYKPLKCGNLCNKDTNLCPSVVM